MVKPDLNKLKAEIDTRKRERGIISSKLGESAGNAAPPRDEFLNGLITSLDTGKSTAATNLIKLVENKTAEKKRETIIHNIDTSTISHNTNLQQNTTPLGRTSLNENESSQDREELLWAEIEKRKKQTLTEQMASMLPQNANAMQQNVNGMLQRPQNLNEGYLVENVKKVVDNYLIENFGPVVEEAIKSTILEMYAVERIKEVLNENREMIKTVVIDVIKEIQAKSKAKAQ